MVIYNHNKIGFLCLILSLSLIWYSCSKDQKVYLNEGDFRDKIYACWLGKNIGGTLGMPFEGDTNMHDLTFYTKLNEGEPAANDDLDLQMLWLKAMQENDAHVDAFTLGQYWLKYIPVNWNEYGVGKRNMRTGLMPPVSGEFDNAKWKPSNGAWIRSEIWACLFPANPLMAARMAREDACVDHGMAEGTFAEIFTASIESAAFLESNRDSLINFGLSMIPSDCRVSQAIKTAVQAYKDGKDWKGARSAVVENTKDMGWFQSPRNVAFTIIGWLYGEGDFGKSICIAIGCGDDTDCTGATLASIFGIIGGTRAIPEKWKEPIGEKITTVAIKGFDAPANLNVLTDSTLAMTKRVIEKYKLPVEVGPGKTRLNGSRKQLEVDRIALERLWKLSPWKVVRHNDDWVMTFDYMHEPYITQGIARNIKMTISNAAGKREIYKVAVSGIPESWKLTGLPADTFGIDSRSKKILDFSIMTEKVPADTTMLGITLTRGNDSDRIPFTLFRKNP